MSLYADYIKEREGYDTIEDETFFVTFIPVSDALYIRDIYIDPEHRSQGKSLEIGLLTERIAKEKGLKAVMGSVDVKTNGWERSKNILEQFGYKEILKEGTIIYFNKDID